MVDEVTNSLSVFTDPQHGGKTIYAGDGEVIYDAETAAQNVYYVQTGQVRLFTVGRDDLTRMVCIISPGQWFGAAALAGAPTYRMRAQSVSDTILTEITAEQLLAALSNDPTQLAIFTRQLAHRLLCTTEETSRLVFDDCNQRLINVLLRFSNSAASTRHEDGVVLRITHDQLAQAVGVARETVSLALTQLRQQNLLRTGRNQLVFNPETLRQFAPSPRIVGPETDESVDPQSS
jgi:CRP/FNR family transcriptional regulator